MNDTNFTIDTVKGLTTYLKSVGSPLKIHNKGADIILKNLTEHGIEIHTDKDGKLYQCKGDGSEVETTMDDVIDLACELNYEDTYNTEQAISGMTDYVAKCKMTKKANDLKADGRILNKIFYQTKYGRKVNMVADKICTELFAKLNLVPIYDVPFYEDKIVSEPSLYESEKNTDREEAVIDVQAYETPAEDLEADDISEEQIVSADSPSFTEEEPEEVVEQSKGAR